MLTPPTAVREALLVLEDGTALRGEGFGAAGTAFGEVVFNTAMSGYQEVLTDPSYHRQIVTMTGVHQGNYGVTAADAESERVHVAGFVVREASRTWSSWRATRGLDAELADAGVVGIDEVDTRRLTRHIRAAGAMRAGISTDVLDADALVERVRAQPGMLGADLTAEVCTREPYQVGPARPRFRVVAYDFGIKRSILRLLTAAGCGVRVVPSTTTAAEVLADEPDGVFLSNGPGDPAAVSAGTDAVRSLLAERVPVFGICLGHQLLATAAGARTYKLPFGHHGANQPVRDIERGGVQITSHNHGFAVEADSIPVAGPFGRVTQSHVNLNDGVNEGLRCHDVPAFSVQYHPEGRPGPHDARHLFDDFCALMAAQGEGGGASSRRWAGI